MTIAGIQESVAKQKTKPFRNQRRKLAFESLLRANQISGASANTQSVFSAIGGNDAHGDLNDTTSVNTPLISLRHSREHVFGKVRTVVKIAERGFSLESLNEAFAGDNCYITDGPALWWERGEKKITFHARNTQDFGSAFRYIRIFGRRRSTNGKLSHNETVCMESLVLPPAKTDLTVNADDFAYLRAECETATGHFAMTSAAVL